jgi:cyclin A
MDGYFKHEDKVQDTRDIHLIGVASMFSAMKFEEIHPLRLSLITEKIARKKF